MRADARRNRDAILDAAREVFDAEGIGASLDGIAVRAGVGNATLYRNFPTREDLLAAMMAERVDSLVVEAVGLESDRSAAEAFAEWLFRLTWHLRIWHDLPTQIAASIGNVESPVQIVCAPLRDRTEELLDQARTAGAVTPDVTAEDLFELVTALSWGLDRFRDDVPAARRRVALATAGVFRASGPSDG